MWSCNLCLFYSGSPVRVLASHLVLGCGRCSLQGVLGTRSHLEWTGEAWLSHGSPEPSQVPAVLLRGTERGHLHWGPCEGNKLEDPELLCPCSKDVCQPGLPPLHLLVGAVQSELCASATPRGARRHLREEHRAWQRGTAQRPDPSGRPDRGSESAHPWTEARRVTQGRGAGS